MGCGTLIKTSSRTVNTESIQATTLRTVRDLDMRQSWITRRIGGWLVNTIRKSTLYVQCNGYAPQRVVPKSPLCQRKHMLYLQDTAKQLYCTAEITWVNSHLLRVFLISTKRFGVMMMVIFSCWSRFGSIFLYVSSPLHITVFRVGINHHKTHPTSTST